MKKIHLFSFQGIIIPAMLLMLCSACSKKEDESAKTGFLSLNMGISVEVFDVYNNLKAAEPDEFTVIIYNETGNEIISFDRAGDMPDAIELSEGSYYVVAYSDNNLPAAFDNPYYYGESDVFVIVAGETTSVSVTCVLSNIMVTVVYAQSVIDDFTGYETEVSNPEGSLVFGMSETRAGYFNEGPLNIEATLTYMSGGTPETLTLTGCVPGPVAGRNYELHIEASLDDGYGNILLNVDETYDTEVVIIDDEDPSGWSFGDLLITEIMFDPDALSDTEGEWLEVYNNTDETVNLKDLVLRRGSNDATHQISADVELMPGEYAVLGRTATATDNVDYVYGSSINLPNAGEELILNTYGTDGTDGFIICSVDYGDASFPGGTAGSSLQLSSDITNVSEAMLGIHWCESTQAYNTGDLGTPGTVNDICQ